MDNITHSLIGAALGQAGLKKKTGLPMPALITAANLPDIDAPCALYGLESLSMRRGITHGPIALLLLPLLLAGLLWWFDRWQARRGKRPAARLPVNFGWLLALCYIGTLTHPLFDWFNNYGIRLLEPFSEQWFYGDVLFIVDPWIIAMLGLGIWFTRQRERRGREQPARPARLALSAMAGYVALNITISAHLAGIGRYVEPHARLAVANAVPLTFWKREVLLQGAGWGPSFAYELSCDVFTGCETLANDEIARRVRQTNMDDPRIAQWSAHDPAARAFLFWSRMPMAEVHPDHIVLRDQRFMDARTADQFSVTLRPRPE